MSHSGTVVWFRQDLRVADNPAIHHAVQKKEPIYPVYIWAPHEEGEWAPGGASKCWLHYSLMNLDKVLQQLGSRLIIRKGDSLTELAQILEESNCREVSWNRRYEPHAIKRDKQIKHKLQDVGVEANSFNGSLLREPMRITTNKKQPYTVFTPYWKKFTKLGEISSQLPWPDFLSAPKKWPESITIDDLSLLPTRDWKDGIKENWEIGCEHATEKLDNFLDDAIEQYETQRNIPSVLGTSRMSPHLHFGEISPGQIWHAVRNASLGELIPSKDSMSYLRELGWREFAYNLLYHYPETTNHPLKEKYAQFPWRNNASELSCWKKGLTGYPIVDAGMRELWKTGWMHNRVRMIAASFLIKDLLIDWREGARWFWDTLVDADLASNTLGWQWVSGCGADAAPYYRVFNPTLQGEKFDPRGAYIRKWIPEIAGLPNKLIHKPWEADQATLEAANLTLGSDYPLPIIDHKIARERALSIHSQLDGQSGGQLGDYGVNQENEAC